MTIADGDVDIHYKNQHLRADHVEYNDQTDEAVAKGHVIFDYESQHVEADEAHFNVANGKGVFTNVRGSIKLERRPNPTLLVTDSPLYFEAKTVDRLGEDYYIIHEAWVTICDPQHPKWQFFAKRARVRVGKSMALINANFRLLRVPLIWTPYATTPAGENVRQSGLLVPLVGNSNVKGFELGDAYYWAPKPWMDATLGAELLTLRGSSERGEFRITPWEDTSIKYRYYGVIDRGLLNSDGVRESQGGHEQQLEIQSILPDNWRFVADYNELSSLTFRLAFADTFGDAINSEIRSSVFLTHNFGGFSLNFAGLNDQDFLSINPQTSVSLRNVPEVRFGSVDQAPWGKLPFYFGFDAFAGGVHRQDPEINTPETVARTEFAPRVTVPFHFGPWLSGSASGTYRTTYYADSLEGPETVINRALTRNDGEFVLDLRPPTFERVFGSPKSKKKYKHTIEPEITYKDVSGINNFAQLIRFDSDATLTNTNEVDYSVTQRFYSKNDGDDQPTELVSWQLTQKRFFDPYFGGAIVSGQRNVFATLDEVSPFAYALGPRNSSPIVSDVNISPGGKYDTEQLLEYDPQLHKITVIGELLKVKPYGNFYATIAAFRLQADPILQPLSNQVRVLMGYGSDTRKGFNVTTGVSYDITNGALQNELVRASYNGSCCGLDVEYLRIALGQVRTNSEFRVAFIIANIGTFGNLRHQEKIF